MKAVLGKIGAFFGAYYHVLIAVLAVGFMAWSAVAYFLDAEALKQEASEFRRDLAQLEPLHPEADRVDLTPYTRLIAGIDAPFQLGEPDPHVMVPGLRVTCPFCTRPKPFDAMICPFCGEEEKDAAEDPVDKDEDLDADKLPDLWEDAHNLNKRDPRDATSDQDGDGFTALEEFLAGTDPRVAEDHPPLLDRIACRRIARVPFRYQFKSKMRTPDDRVRLTFNDIRSGMTLMVNVGDMVGDDYRVTGLEEKHEEREAAGGNMVMRTDVSEVTLQHVREEDKTVVLVKDTRSTHYDYGVLLVFTLDGSEYRVWEGREFTLNGDLHVGRSFKVKEVDSKLNRVLIEDLKTGRSTWCGEGEGL